MKPFLLKPAIKDYIWGGTRLREEFGKESDFDRLAESWELSCHPDGEGFIASGELEGMSFAKFAQEHPEALGEKCTQFDTFPVLIKLIDARGNLSVQVHPDNDYARKYENDNGKTEMWYIVDCEEGAELIYGFKDKLTKEQFRAAIADNTLLEYVNRVPVKKGDVFFIKPGTLHAIGKGILIAEIQQSSNVTYRVYDYGRLGADGKPRELHVEKAIEVTSLDPSPEQQTNGAENIGGSVSVQKLASCEYFDVEKYEIGGGELRLENRADSFRHILVIDGECEVFCGGEQVLTAKKGSGVFVPAGTDNCCIKGNCTIIITVV